MRLIYEISELAKSDLDDIWIYTAGNWSVSQANKYYEWLIEGIISICENPNMGKSIHNVKKSHRMFQVKSHLIIYKIAKECIYIDRILHKRMDFESRLKAY